MAYIVMAYIVMVYMGMAAVLSVGVSTPHPAVGMPSAMPPGSALRHARRGPAHRSPFFGKKVRAAEPVLPARHRHLQHPRRPAGAARKKKESRRWLAQVVSAAQMKKVVLAPPRVYGLRS